MEAGLREVCRSVRIGKILIQRVRAALPSSFSNSGLNAMYVHIGRGDGTAEAVLFQGTSRHAMLGLLGDERTRNPWCSFLKTSRSGMCCCSIPCSVRRPRPCVARGSRLFVDLSMARTATGGSAIKAVEVLKEHGVPEERIIFINLVRVLDL